MTDKATLTHRASLSLGHCLWPSAGGEMAWVEEVGVQGMAKAPEARRCPRGFWRVACMYVSGVQGGPWWGWTTGCSHLLKTAQRRHRGRSNEAEQAGGDKWFGKKLLIVWNTALVIRKTFLTIVYDSICCIVCVRIVIICRRKQQSLIGMYTRKYIMAQRGQMCSFSSGDNYSAERSIKTTQAA